MKIKADEASGRATWEIYLVGHSMGTIVIDQMLRETLELKLELPIKAIVYMAAAASVREVIDSVVPYLQSNVNAHFYNLMLHHVADEREPYIRPFGIPVDPTPRGSLLVLIDNFLSKPLSYLDRTAGRYDNFLPAVHDVPGNLWPRVHIKAFSVGDDKDTRDANPQRHGEFSERFKFWMPDCWSPEPAMKRSGRDPRDCMYDPAK